MAGAAERVVALVIHEEEEDVGRGRLIVLGGESRQG
jgi:hypothetical protein